MLMPWVSVGRQALPPPLRLYGDFSNYSQGAFMTKRERKSVSSVPLNAISVRSFQGGYALWGTFTNCTDLPGYKFLGARGFPWQELPNVSFCI